MIPIGATVEQCLNLLRLAAWYGDAAHHLDVRMAVAMGSGRCESLVGCEENYVSNEAQSMYWKNTDTKLLPWQPIGSNNHSIATAFEANYEGSFRETYLRDMFPDRSETIIKYWTPPVYASVCTGCFGNVCGTS